MKDMVQLTGGQVVQIDTFTNVVFKESLKRMFAKEGEEGFLGMSSHATLEVLPSRDIKVGGWGGGRVGGWEKGTCKGESPAGTSRWVGVGKEGKEATCTGSSPNGRAWAGVCGCLAGGRGQGMLIN
jgi:hypothetical protein